jgi:hypothetical protein
MQEVIKMSTTSAVAGNGLAQIDIPVDGVIEGVDILMNGVTGAGTDGGMRGQLSFGSAYVTSNDSRQVICEGTACCSTPVAATALPFQSHQYVPMSLQVAGGERLFVHLLGLGTAPGSLTTTFTIYLAHKGAGANSRSRYRT